MPDTKAIVDDRGPSADPLGTPEEEDQVHPWDLGEVVQLQVLVETKKGGNDTETVDVEEGLVEGVTERRPCLNTKEGKCYGSYHTPAV